jgi:hypothetical protein
MNARHTAFCLLAMCYAFDATAHAQSADIIDRHGRSVSPYPGTASSSPYSMMASPSPYTGRPSPSPYTGTPSPSPYPRMPDSPGPGR